MLDVQVGPDAGSRDLSLVTSFCSCVPHAHVPEGSWAVVDTAFAMLCKIVT